MKYNKYGQCTIVYAGGKIQTSSGRARFPGFVANFGTVTDTVVNAHLPISINRKTMTLTDKPNNLLLHNEDK